MPPRRSSRLAVVAEQALAARCVRVAAAGARAGSPFPPLPLELALRIFALLPVDVRLFCCEVCRAWRAALEERSLWTRLDLSEQAGLTHSVSAALLLAAAARARGQLQSLDVHMDGCSTNTLVEVVAANAGTLRELRHTGLCAVGREEIEALLAAAPLLPHLEAYGCTGSLFEARQMLRCEGTLARLRLAKLLVNVHGADADDMRAFAADLLPYPFLQKLELSRAPVHLPGALDALVDAALVQRLAALASVDADALHADSVAALARLLNGGTLTQLELSSGDSNAPVFDAQGAQELSNALRATSTLTHLRLDSLLGEDALVALLDALTGHHSLRVLRFPYYHHNANPPLAPLGAALGALIAANAPALQQLTFCITLPDGDFAPMAAALALNTNLRTLHLNAEMATDACWRDVLLPAVHANTSLRALWVDTSRASADTYAREAMELVAAREKTRAPRRRRRR